MLLYIENLVADISFSPLKVPLNLEMVQDSENGTIQGPEYGKSLNYQNKALNRSWTSKNAGAAWELKGERRIP